MHATFVMLWLQVVQPLANVHETKWTPHVKRESDVAQSYNSSDIMQSFRCFRTEAHSTHLQCVCQLHALSGGQI